MDTEYNYELAADGKAIEIRMVSSTGHQRDLFIRDRQGQLLRRETAGEAMSTRWLVVFPEGPFKRRIDYRYDGRGRRTSAVHSDLSITDSRVVTVTKQVRYAYDGDHLVAVEWTARGEVGVQAWRLSYDGARLIQTRFEVDGRVSTLRNYQYDSLGRRTTALHVSASGSTPSNYEFRYDPAGKLISRDVVYHGERRPEQRFEYDAAGRVTQFFDREFENRYTYDDAGRITRIESESSVSMFVHGGGCTANNTAALVPDPVSYVLDDLWIDHELWLRVHPEWEGDTPWF